MQIFWREKDSLHINVKELEAAIATVKSLARPREKVLLSVDNLVAYTYLTKGGGRKRHFNQILRPFLKWCLEKQIHLSVQWVPSEEMKADALSRWNYDKGDYTLDKSLFQGLLQKFSPWVSPQIDMFASPGNAQLEKFVTRWPHHQALWVDALKCPLEGAQEIYANPPGQ